MHENLFYAYLKLSIDRLIKRKRLTLGVDNEKTGIEDPEECIVCGTRIKRVHCTYMCSNCGFRTDCSDL
jgi:hypothetical protein